MHSNLLAHCCQRRERDNSESIAWIVTDSCLSQMCVQHRSLTADQISQLNFICCCCAQLCDENFVYVALSATPSQLKPVHEIVQLTEKCLNVCNPVESVFSRYRGKSWINTMCRENNLYLIAKHLQPHNGRTQLHIMMIFYDRNAIIFMECTVFGYRSYPSFGSRIGGDSFKIVYCLARDKCT